MHIFLVSLFIILKNTSTGDNEVEYASKNEIFKPINFNVSKVMLEW